MRFFFIVFLPVIFLSCRHFNNETRRDEITRMKDWKNIQSQYHLNKGPFQVFVAYNRDCPLCKAYTGRLNEISDSFGNVSFVLLKSTDKNKLLHGNQILDTLQHLSGKLGFTVTPEVLVVRNDGVVIYRGKVDDQGYETGKHRLKAKHHYLRDVLADLKKGVDSVHLSTTPAGCYIEEIQH